MATSTTYPVPAITNTQDLTVEQIHQLLKNESAIARRVRTLADQRFIADALLTGRYTAQGGAILYETGEEIFAPDDPEAIEPGGEYPRSQIYAGELAAAKVTKWGRDVPITDEAIKRRGMSELNKILEKLVNRMVKFVDQAALGVIASKVVRTESATGAWTDTQNIIETVELAKAKAIEEGEGYSLDTIVLKPTQYARIMARFLASGLLPREAANPLMTGVWPQLLDLTWMYSAHTPTEAPMLLDTNDLGGMADEDLGGPGYSKALNGIEVKSIREDKIDSYLLRSRRVTVPVVLEPDAGRLITETGL